MKHLIIICFVLLLSIHTSAQENQPPRLGGIVKTTYLVSDYALAQSYYGDFLGFDKVFTYNSPQGKVVSYKVNDRQFLEFIEHYPTDTRDFSHPCFVADDLQEVLYTLKERRKDEKLADPNVGKGRRWLLNLSTADGTRVEFTEMFLAK